MRQREKAIPEADVAISSRIRLARNLEAYPFPSRLSDSQRDEILEKVKSAALGSSELSAKKPSYLEMGSLNQIDKQLLVEKHLISPEFLENDTNRAVIISSDGEVSIMINEEDHIRLQCIYPGMQLNEAWELCSRIDTQMEKTLGYAFDKSIGYLTCCPTNIGTGMRASVMLHLPALSMTGYIRGVLETCPKLGITVRGMYGENTEASGNMFQISNQITLGQTEEEIVVGVSNFTSQIAKQERMLREEFYRQNPVKLEDRIFRAFGILSNARTISSEECLKLLSDVRLGVVLGLIPGIDPVQINELMLLIQPANLQKVSKKQLSAEQRDQKRAELLREKLGSKN